MRAIRLLSLEDRERGLDLIVLVVFVLDVVVYAVDFLRPMLVRTPLPVIEFGARFKKHRARTFCSMSISSPSGLSALYLTLFQWKLLRYWSTGSSSYQPILPAICPKSSLTIVDSLLLLYLLLVPP